MGDFASVFGPLAVQLTQMFGQTLSFSREQAGEYNPDTGETGPAVVMTYSAFGAPVDYEADEIDGTIIEREDTRIYIHRIIGVIPKVGDLVVDFRGGDWRVMNVQIFPVNAVDVLYGLQVRK